mgnify:FL=1|jgi:hypothetical protein
MIDRTNLPDFLQEMPVERLRELMNVDDNSGNFDKTMDKMLHTDKKKKAKSKARTKSSLSKY